MNEGQTHMKLYSRKEAASMIGIHVNYLDRMCRSGRIGYYQRLPGKKVQFSQEQIDEYTQTHKWKKGGHALETVHEKGDR